MEYFILLHIIVLLTSSTSVPSSKISFARSVVVVAIFKQKFLSANLYFKLVAILQSCLGYLMVYCDISVLIGFQLKKKSFDILQRTGI